MAPSDARTRVYLAVAESDTARSIRTALDQAGCRVQEAMDWSLVAEEVGLFGADAIFLSHRLPGIDTRFIIAQLKEDPRTRDRAVIITVPQGEPQRADEVLTWGADDFLPVPAQKALIVQRVRLHGKKSTPSNPSVPAIIDLPDLPSTDSVASMRAVSSEDRATHPGLKAARAVAAEVPAGIDGYYEQDMGCVIEVAEALASSLPTADALYILVKRIAQSLPVTRCNVALRGARSSEAIVVASQDDPALRRQTVELGRYPEIRRCLEGGETVLIEDVRKDPEMEKILDFITLVDLRSVLVVPLFVREVAVGTLALTTRRESHGFTRRELLFVRAMANLAAGVLSTGALLEDVRRAALSRNPSKGQASDEDEVLLDLDDQIDGLIAELDRK